MEQFELKSSYPKEIERYVVDTIHSAMKTIKTEKQGKRGIQGKKGDKGEPGGIYQNKGVLQNQKYPNQVVERAYGVQPTSKLFLTQKTHLPQQIWIHTTDGKIKSQYNPSQCIHVDEDKNVYMTHCDNATQWNYVNRTGQLRSKQPIKGKDICLSVQKGGTFEGHRINPKEKVNTTKLPKVKNMDLLIGEPCETKSEQIFSFY